MITMATILIIIVSATLFFGGLGLIRNELVYHYRVKLLFSKLDEYEALPPYDEMMKKFWIWRMCKFNKYEVDRRKG